jgi:hypothetical protein
MLRDQLDARETELEKQIRSLRRNIETRMPNFGARDIAMFSGSIPSVPTMLEMRNEREDFLAHLERLEFRLKPQYYTEEALADVMKKESLTPHTPDAMVGFFQRESERICFVRDRITSRMQDAAFFPKCEQSYRLFMKEAAIAIKNCEVAIAMLRSQTDITESHTHLETIIDCRFVRRQQKLLLRILYDEIRALSLTHRHEIMRLCLSRVEASLQANDRNRTHVVPVLLREEAAER